MAETKVAAPPLVSRINIVYLYARDVPRSAAFYRDVLGLPMEVEESGGWAEAKLPDGSRFALHKIGEGQTPQQGTISINLEVGDIDAAAERLRAAGVAVGTIAREFWGSAVEVTDPDGYEVTLFQPPRPT